MTVDLRTERRNRGMTLKDVAELVGVTESSMSLYERGLSAPHAPTAFKIASLYGVKVSDIWPPTGNDEPKAAA